MRPKNLHLMMVAQLLPYSRPLEGRSFSHSHSLTQRSKIFPWMKCPHGKNPTAPIRPSPYFLSSPRHSAASLETLVLLYNNVFYLGLGFLLHISKPTKKC